MQAFLGPRLPHGSRAETCSSGPTGGGDEGDTEFPGGPLPSWHLTSGGAKALALKGVLGTS